MDEYPAGFEFMAESKEESNPNRINGFAPGDRIQVTSEDNEHYGKFGRVINSWGGCWPEVCGPDRNCRIVEVDFGKADDKPHFGYSSSPLFRPKDLTIVD